MDTNKSKSKTSFYLRVPYNSNNYFFNFHNLFFYSQLIKLLPILHLLIHMYV